MLRRLQSSQQARRLLARGFSQAAPAVSSTPESSEAAASASAAPQQATRINAALVRKALVGNQVGLTRQKLWEKVNADEKIQASKNSLTRVLNSLRANRHIIAKPSDSAKRFVYRIHPLYTLKGEKLQRKAAAKEAAAKIPKPDLTVFREQAETYVADELKRLETPIATRPERLVTTWPRVLSLYKTLSAPGAAKASSASDSSSSSTAPAAAAAQGKPSFTSSQNGYESSWRTVLPVFAAQAVVGKPDPMTQSLASFFENDEDLHTYDRVNALLGTVLNNVARQTHKSAKHRERYFVIEKAIAPRLQGAKDKAVKQLTELKTQELYLVDKAFTARKKAIAEFDAALQAKWDAALEKAAQHKQAVARKRENRQKAQKLANKRDRNSGDLPMSDKKRARLYKKNLPLQTRRTFVHPINRRALTVSQLAGDLKNRRSALAVVYSSVNQLKSAIQSLSTDVGVLLAKYQRAKLMQHAEQFESTKKQLDELKDKVETIHAQPRERASLMHKLMSLRPRVTFALLDTELDQLPTAIKATSEQLSAAVQKLVPQTKDITSQAPVLEQQLAPLVAARKELTAPFLKASIKTGSMRATRRLRFSRKIYLKTLAEYEAALAKGPVPVEVRLKHSRARQFLRRALATWKRSSKRSLKKMQVPPQVAATWKKLNSDIASLKKRMLDAKSGSSPAARHIARARRLQEVLTRAQSQLEAGKLSRSAQCRLLYRVRALSADSSSLAASLNSYRYAELHLAVDSVSRVLKEARTALSRPIRR